MGSVSPVLKDPLGIGRSSLYTPLFVVYSVTKLCNLKCFYCFADSSPKQYADELTTEQALSVIDQCVENNVLEIRFSGGEPLMRKDFFTILEYTHEKEIRSIVESNGTLVTKKAARRLKELGAAVVGVSMDGGTPETHEQSRGVKGCFKRSLSGIETLTEEGLILRINYRVTMENLEELPHLLESLPSFENIDCVQLYRVADVGRCKGSTMISPEESEKILTYIDTLKENYPLDFTSGYGIHSRRVSDEDFLRMMEQGEKEDVEFPVCGAGRTQVNVWYNGLVKPCEIWPAEDAVGHIRDGLTDLWQHAPLFQKLRSADIACRKCPLFNGCGGGCRFESRLEGGLTSPPPSCLHGRLL